MNPLRSPVLLEVRLQHLDLRLGLLALLLQLGRDSSDLQLNISLCCLISVRHLVVVSPAIEDELLDFFTEVVPVIPGIILISPGGDLGTAADDNGLQLCEERDHVVQGHLHQPGLGIGPSGVLLVAALLSSDLSLELLLSGSKLLSRRHDFLVLGMLGV